MGARMRAKYKLTSPTLIQLQTTLTVFGRVKNKSRIVGKKNGDIQSVQMDCHKKPQSVSRKHASITRRPIATVTASSNASPVFDYFIVDHQTTNGTIVNGTCIKANTKVRLKHGDTIVLGPLGSTVFYTFELGDHHDREQTQNEHTHTVLSAAINANKDGLCKNGNQGERDGDNSGSHDNKCNLGSVDEHISSLPSLEPAPFTVKSSPASGSASVASGSSLALSSVLMSSSSSEVLQTRVDTASVNTGEEDEPKDFEKNEIAPEEKEQNANAPSIDDNVKQEQEQEQEQEEKQQKQTEGKMEEATVEPPKPRKRRRLGAFIGSLSNRKVKETLGGKKKKKNKEKGKTKREHKEKERRAGDEEAPSDFAAEGDVEGGAQKTSKSEQKVKKPMSAYLFFCRENRSRIKHIYAGKTEETEEKQRCGSDSDSVKDKDNERRKDCLSFGDVSRLLGQQWRSLRSGEKQQYTALAQQDKQRYKREMKAALSGCEGEEDSDGDGHDHHARTDTNSTTSTTAAAATSNNRDDYRDSGATSNDTAIAEDESNEGIDEDTTVSVRTSSRRRRSKRKRTDFISWSQVNDSVVDNDVQDDGGDDNDGDNDDGDDEFVQMDVAEKDDKDYNDIDDDDDDYDDDE